MQNIWTNPQSKHPPKNEFFHSCPKPTSHEGEKKSSLVNRFLSTSMRANRNCICAPIVRMNVIFILLTACHKEFLFKGTLHNQLPNKA